MSFAKAAFSTHQLQDTLPQQFKTIWQNVAQYKVAHTEEASFLSQCDNTLIIDSTTK